MLSCLPLDIVKNHIMPFTYRPQPKELLADIRHYMKTINEIFFPGRYNLPLLKRDIATSYYWYYFESFSEILSRHFMIRENEAGIDRYIFQFLKFDSTKGFRVFWGMMSSDERQTVMNRIKEEEKYYRQLK
jgi:hypothetical protein